MFHCMHGVISVGLCCTIQCSTVCMVSSQLVFVARFNVPLYAWCHLSWSLLHDSMFHCMHGVISVGLCCMIQCSTVCMVSSQLVFVARFNVPLYAWCHLSWSLLHDSMFHCMHGVISVGLCCTIQCSTVCMVSSQLVFVARFNVPLYAWCHLSWSLLHDSMFHCMHGVISVGLCCMIQCSTVYMVSSQLVFVA